MIIYLNNKSFRSPKSSIIPALLDGLIFFSMKDSERIYLDKVVELLLRVDYDRGKLYIPYYPSVDFEKYSKNIY
jgi:hypothetical protein